MSLSEEAIRGVTQRNTEAVTPETKPLPTYLTAEPPDFPGQILDALYDASKLRPRFEIIGSKENPYTLTVPGWAEDQSLAENGMTAQEVADMTFRPHVKVVVVRDY